MRKVIVTTDNGFITFDINYHYLVILNAILSTSDNVKHFVVHDKEQMKFEPPEDYGIIDSQSKWHFPTLKQKYRYNRKKVA